MRPGHPDRWIQGPFQRGAERDVVHLVDLALVGHVWAGPQCSNQGDGLQQPADPTAGGHLKCCVIPFLPQPHPEGRPATAEPVQGADLVGDVDRMEDRKYKNGYPSRTVVVAAAAKPSAIKGSSEAASSRVLLVTHRSSKPRSSARRATSPTTAPLSGCADRCGNDMPKVTSSCQAMVDYGPKAAAWHQRQFRYPGVPGRAWDSKRSGCR